MALDERRAPAHRREADELELTAAGRTVTIWVVHVGDRLYFRSWRSRSGGWFGRAQEAGRGRISAGGIRPREHARGRRLRTVAVAALAAARNPHTTASS